MRGYQVSTQMLNTGSGRCMRLAFINSGDCLGLYNWCRLAVTTPSSYLDLSRMHNRIKRGGTPSRVSNLHFVSDNRFSGGPFKRASVFYRATQVASGYRRPVVKYDPSTFFVSVNCGRQRCASQSTAFRIIAHRRLRGRAQTDCDDHIVRAMYL